jgi:hypothetical protein
MIKISLLYVCARRLRSHLSRHIFILALASWRPLTIDRKRRSQNATTTTPDLKKKKILINIIPCIAAQALFLLFLENQPQVSYGHCSSEASANSTEPLLMKLTAGKRR